MHRFLEHTVQSYVTVVTNCGCFVVHGKTCSGFMSLIEYRPHPFAYSGCSKALGDQ